MTCDSCGIDADDLYPVRRTYVVTDTSDRMPHQQTQVDIERWCFPCLTHYPHEPAPPQIDSTGERT